LQQVLLLIQMLEILNKLDTRIFLYLNSHHSPFWDFIFWNISQKPLVWLPVYLLILAIIIYKYKKRSWVIVLAIIILICLSDQISSSILKIAVARLRPTHEPGLQGFVHILHNYFGGLYGFVSSHAANTFAVTTFTILLFRNKIYSCCILLWPISVSYSRIYLGVHYPGDVICGALLGIILGILVFKGTEYLIKLINTKSSNKNSKN